MQGEITSAVTYMMGKLFNLKLKLFFLITTLCFNHNCRLLWDFKQGYRTIGLDLDLERVVMNSLTYTRPDFKTAICSMDESPLLSASQQERNGQRKRKFWRMLNKLSLETISHEFSPQVHWIFQAMLGYLFYLKIHEYSSAEAWHRLELVASKRL
jgi:hypothetical protein